MSNQIKNNLIIPKIAIKTMGCKLNYAESQQIASQFSNFGFEIVNFSEIADIYILNICAVTHVAEKKSRQLINQAKKKGKVFITGCTADKNITESPYFIKDKKQIFSIISNKFPQIKTQNINKETIFSESRTRAFIKIQSGCSCFCSYCIIPYLRGKPTSIPITYIITQIKNSEKQGFKEIILTGININLYNDNGNDLVTLCQTILKETNIPRIRFGSIHPAYINDNFINLFKKKRICNQIHLSLQSGSNNILKLMNRPYTNEQYLNITKKIKNINPNFAITTDIIVGFPGETEQDFQDSMNIMKKVPLAKSHIFPYSPRQGTKAASLKEQFISPEVIKERAFLLRKNDKELNNSFLNKNIGLKTEVLIETEDNNYYYGYTDNYIRVKIKKSVNNNNLINEIVKITIDIAHLILE